MHVLLVKIDKLSRKWLYQKRFDIEPVYNEKYKKAKKKSYEGKTNTTF